MLDGIVTAHWSATGPVRLGDYHDEFWLRSTPPPALLAEVKAFAQYDWSGAVATHGAAAAAANGPKLDLDALFAHFQSTKNYPFTQATRYGTYLLNHDPRDGGAAPNIEVGAMCMGGESVTTTGPWGAYPYTYAHFVIQAAIIGIICKLKGLDPLASFPVPEGATVLQNGPIYVVSTHAERAIQTQDGPAASLRPYLGYFIFSGDPDSRWDIAAPDVSEAKSLATASTAAAYAKRTAARLRSIAAVAIERGFSSYWNLNQ